MLFARRCTCYTWASNATQTQIEEPKSETVDFDAGDMKRRPSVRETIEKSECECKHTKSSERFCQLGPFTVIILATLISFLIPTMCHIPESAKIEYTERKAVTDSLQHIWKTIKDLEKGQKTMETKMERMSSGLSKITAKESEIITTNPEKTASNDKTPTDETVNKESVKKSESQAGIEAGNDENKNLEAKDSKEIKKEPEEDVSRLRGGTSENQRFGKVYRSRSPSFTNIKRRNCIPSPKKVKYQEEYDRVRPYRPHGPYGMHFENSHKRKYPSYIYDPRKGSYQYIDNLIDSKEGYYEGDEYCIEDDDF